MQRLRAAIPEPGHPLADGFQADPEGGGNCSWRLPLSRRAIARSRRSIDKARVMSAGLLSGRHKRNHEPPKSGILQIQLKLRLL